MKLKRIICFALSFAAVACMFLVRDSVAWVDTHTGTPLGQYITASRLFIEFSGNLGTDFSYDTMTGVSDTSGEFIIPGQNLVVDNGGKITGTNYSTIVTEIRVLVEYDGDEYTGLNGDDFVVEFADGWSKGDDDNFFYYTAGLPALTGAQVAAGTGVQFDIIDGIYYDVDGTYAGLGAEVTVTIQAKQAEHVEWDTLRTWVATLP